MKTQRQREDWTNCSEYLERNDEKSTLNDAELLERLESNDTIAERNLQKVFDFYSEQQDKMTIEEMEDLSANEEFD